MALDELGVDSLDLLRLTYAIERHYRVDLSGFSHADFQSLERLTGLLAQAIHSQQSQ